MLIESYIPLTLAYPASRRLPKARCFEFDYLKQKVVEKKEKK